VRVLGPAFTDVWGPVDSANEEKAFARYRSLLNDGALAAADPKRGRSVFLRTCGPCHKMYGEGGEIGPDLTGSNRANRDYLLFNVLNPSGEVQDAYKMVVITTRDGRTLSGTIAAENARQVTLRVIGREPVVVNKSDVQWREVTAVSLMPPGLFDTLEDREILDLVAFLRTVEPVK
jgi:putative heme-binding domain-containing protein